jgi:hypothetical protein
VRNFHYYITRNQDLHISEGELQAAVMGWACEAKEGEK